MAPGWCLIGRSVFQDGRGAEQLSCQSYSLSRKMLVLISKLILVPKDHESGGIFFMLSFALSGGWIPDSLMLLRGEKHSCDRNGGTGCGWTLWCTTAKGRRSPLLGNSTHGRRNVFCVPHTLAFHSLEEDVAWKPVWKGVHQGPCVSHRIKCWQQWGTTDAALFSCGPSGGERWKSTINPHVCSLPSSWFVFAFQWAARPSIIMHYQHPGSPPVLLAAWVHFLRKLFEAHKIKNHW